MPCFDGPFHITAINEQKFTITLDLPPHSKQHPTFHTSQVLPYKENDTLLFPSCEFMWPPPITNETGNEEFFVWDIIDEHCSGCSYKYLAQWVGYGEEENCWLPCKLLEDTKALDIWLVQKV